MRFDDLIALVRKRPTSLMISSNSRQTLLANLMQQGAAAALLLVLPNLLVKDDYAQVVFVATQIGFMALADLGMSLVYGRVVPRLLTAGDRQAVECWDTSVSLFGSVATVFFSLVISLMFWVKFRHVGHALALAALPLGLYWISFYISRMTAASNFGEYRRAVGMRSLASLLAIPFTIAGGVSGWFLSQVGAGLLVILCIPSVQRRPIGQVDWALIREHLPEALLLCGVTAAWIQLLNFGRLYASMEYPAEAVAQYGVVGAAYQSLSTLLISTFIPVSVSLLGRLGKSDLDAFEYLRTVLARCVWWGLAGTVIATEVAIQALGIIFPRYTFDTITLLGLLSGIALYPFFLLLGNCMVGKQKTKLYLGLIVLALLVSFLVAKVVDAHYLQQGAAWGQLAGLVTFTFGLCHVAKCLFGPTANKVWSYLERSLLAVTSMIVIYAVVRVQITDWTF